MSMPLVPAAPAGTAWSRTCCAPGRAASRRPPIGATSTISPIPQQPLACNLPSGRATGFAVAMKRLVEELRAALPAAFERDEYRVRRDALEQQFKQRSEQSFAALQEQAEAKNIALIRTPMGLGLAPRRDGKVLTPDLFEALPTDERERIRHEIEGIQHQLEAIMQQVPQWEREHREALQALNRETTGFAISHLMGELRAGFADLPEVGRYLDAVERDVKENADDFLPSPAIEAFSGNAGAASRGPGAR